VDPVAHAAKQPTGIPTPVGAAGEREESVDHELSERACAEGSVSR
jgi:hypothetical protein